MIEDPFQQVALALILATFGGLFVSRLKQPLIVAYLIVGVLIGPGVFGLISHEGPIELMADLGVALLLFLVGLRLDIGILRKIGRPSLATGIGQVISTGAIGILVTLAIGMDLVTAIYIGLAITFSSTIVIVKILSDKREIDSLHGRLSIGFLIVQDIIVVLVIIALNAAGGGTGSGSGFNELIIRGLAFIVAIALLMRFVLPKLSEWVGSPPELGIVFALAWAISLAAVGEVLGFGSETGAFVAGFSLAPTAYRDMMAARLTGVRDFLLLFFFIALGTRIDISLIQGQIAGAVVLSLFVLIGNPLILMVILGIMGYRKRTGFLTGLSSAQVSEFSLILIGLGVGLGQIREDAVSLVTLIAIITIAISIYMLTYSSKIYARIEKFLDPFERKKPYRETAEELRSAAEAGSRDVILYGLGRLGGAVASRLDDRKIDYIGFDFDPNAVEAGRESGRDVYLGDIEDPDFVATLPLESARIVISTVRTTGANKILVDSLRQHKFEGTIVIAAHTEEEADDLKPLGADMILMPFEDAADRAGEIVAEVCSQDRNE